MTATRRTRRRLPCLRAIRELSCSVGGLGAVLDVPLK
jgi:hypothetical protein